MSFWAQFAAACARRRPFEVRLQKAWERRVYHAAGVTKMRAGERNLLRYAGYTQPGKRPLCWRRGCRRRLTVKQSFACSADCQQALVSYACQILVLSGAIDGHVGGCGAEEVPQILAGLARLRDITAKGVP